ncbi:hypothetical protein CM15mP43_02870 [bacterium]|nr:MAG: hypothetical protein CM15mP43_02870 [bacterium]
MKEYFSYKDNLIFKNVEDTYALMLSKKPSGQVFIKKNIIVEKGYEKLYIYDAKKYPKRILNMRLSGVIMKSTIFQNFIHDKIKKRKLLIF